MQWPNCVCNFRSIMNESCRREYAIYAAAAHAARVKCCASPIES